MLINYEFILFGLISLVAIVLIISFILSVFNHREEIKFYTFLFREDGRLSKINITFLFVLPIVLYQAVSTSSITTGLLEILWAVFAADLGVKGINKWNTINGKTKIGKSRKSRYDEEDEDIFDDDLYRR